jgi:hypothetical protein
MSIPFDGSFVTNLTNKKPAVDYPAMPAFFDLGKQL